ncbi:hypothetical protein QTJ16_006696 [Diplocarpon rosae]|uniref:Uncharacterized protein n=1 Tax=Diplocarpon rosae TaxID=946125 RepID=A0AAD9WA51_9HELO|nr:hypothetical protein QTJ16_006696 [Diplocarpon rosae]
MILTSTIFGQMYLHWSSNKGKLHQTTRTLSQLYVTSETTTAPRDMKSSSPIVPKLLSSTESERLALRKIRAKRRALTKRRPRSPLPRRPWVSIFRIQRLVTEACAQTLTEANQDLEEEVKGELREEWWMVVDDCFNVFWERLRCSGCGGICGAENWRNEGQGLNELERFLEKLRAEMDMSEPWELHEDEVDRWDMLLWDVEKAIATSRREGCVFAAEAAAQAEMERLRTEEARREEVIIEQAQRYRDAKDQEVSERENELQRFAAVGSPVQLYEDWKYEIKENGEDSNDSSDEEMKMNLNIGTEASRGGERDRAEVDILSTIDELDDDGLSVRVEGKPQGGSFQSRQGLCTADELDEEMDEEALSPMLSRLAGDAISTNEVAKPFMIDDLDELDDSDQDDKTEIETAPKQEQHSNLPDTIPKIEPVAAVPAPSSPMDETEVADDNFQPAIAKDTRKGSEACETDTSSSTQYLHKDSTIQDEDSRSLFCEEDEDMNDKSKELVAYFTGGDSEEDMEGGGYVDYIMSGNVRDLGGMVCRERDESEEL